MLKLDFVVITDVGMYHIKLYERCIVGNVVLWFVYDCSSGVWTQRSSPGVMLVQFRSDSSVSAQGFSANLSFISHKGENINRQAFNNNNNKNNLTIISDITKLERCLF